MQQDTITLAVDETNTGGATVDHVYTRAEEYANRSVYINSNHDLMNRDLLALYRTFNKVNGNFRGTAKSTVKMTKDYGVLGVDGVATLTSPLIVEVSFSVPVGIDSVGRMLARQKAISMLDNDVIMEKLMGQLLV